MHATSDTITSVVDVIGKMSEMEYVYLLFKLGLIVLGAFTTLITFLFAAYKAFTLVWGMVMRHIRESLAASFVSPQQLKQTFQESEKYFMEIMRRLDDGDQRMWDIENRCAGAHPPRSGALRVVEGSSLETMGGSLAS